MAKQKTKDCSWPSIKNPGSWVTANQYIMELLFINEARTINDADLPREYWKKLPEWGDKKFAAHGRSVSKLLKKYESQAIINAVKSKRIFSLRPKWVEKIIQQEQKKLEAKRIAQKAEIATKPKEEPEPIIGNSKRAHRPTKFASLLALDEEENNGEEESKRDEVSE